jgi:hypothetical protein
MKKILFCLWLEFVSLTVTIMFLVFPLSVNAAQITESDFINPVVFDYNGLGLPGNNTTPIVIGGNTYTTNDSNMRYGAFGTNNCVSGECIGSNTENGFIDIVLNTPTLRAGGWVGFSSGNVQFFDENDVLLGTVPVAAVPNVSIAFAGWEADTGLIKRIRINDTDSNIFIISFDNLTTEQPASISVPATTEWGMTAFIVLAGLGSIYYLKSRKIAEN